MFTGLVEELGYVAALEPIGDGIRLRLAAKTVMDDIEMGASIAVNGVCLTVVEFDSEHFAIDAVPETMDRTSLGSLDVGSTVNLERAVRASDRLGGHIVQGHVDATTQITNIESYEDGSWRYHFALAADAAAYVVEKGSITIDGISLTVASLSDTEFSIAVIPHTAEVTTLGSRNVGDLVNLEVDVLAKYVERQLAVLTAAQSQTGGTHS